jgi:hypothetical protein
MTGKGTALAHSGSRAAGILRDVARYALTGGAEWSAEVALPYVPEGGAQHFPAAIADYEAKLRPLAKAEPALDGPMTRECAQAFAPIGAKMRPDMSQEQAGFWASAIVLAMSDLPAFVVTASLREAVHVPYSFPTDMERGVREIAERKLQEHKTAVHRLRILQEAIRRAASPPQPQLPAQAEEPMSMDELRAMMRSPLARTFVNIGLGTGAIRREDLDAVQAELDAEGEQTA